MSKENPVILSDGRRFAPLEWGPHFGENYDPSIIVRKMLENPPDIRKIISQFSLDPAYEPSALALGESIRMPWPEFYVEDYRTGLSDGRRLASQIRGKPDGIPFLSITGTPSGRYGDRTSPYELYQRNIALYTLDIPGYGRSDRQEGRTVSSTAIDVKELAQAFGIKKFKAIFGRSGGAPKALACGDLTEQIITLGAPAPIDADIPNLKEKLAQVNESDAELDAEGFISKIAERIINIQNDPFSLIQEISGGFQKADWEFLKSPDNLIGVATSHSLALEFPSNRYGWIDDEFATNRQPWDIDLRSLKIPDNGIQLWGGLEDTFCPTGYTEWLGTQIKGAKVKISNEFSHFTGMDLGPFIEVLVPGSWDYREVPPEDYYYNYKDIKRT
jgi:pimeloyl-ACP methyl ester carboxylesterase